jgi:hypothetical protein
VKSHVTAQWTIPTLTRESPNDLLAAQWVKIDGTGIGDPYLMQDGTETDCVGRAPVYIAWYEFLGDDAVNDGFEVPLSSSQYSFAPGGIITATVDFAGGVWTFTVVDSTEEWTFATNVPNPSPAPDRGSAEWIVEDPQVSTSKCVQGGLVNFGSVTFTNVSATGKAGTHPIIYDSSYGFQMVDSAAPPVAMASPGVRSDDGTSFTVTWQSSS